MTSFKNDENYMLPFEGNIGAGASLGHGHLIFISALVGTFWILDKTLYTGFL